MALDNKAKVVKFAQELLLDERDDAKSVTPAAISKAIETVVSIKPTWGEGLDRVAVTEELIRRFSIWMGEEAILKSEHGHEDWLSAGKKHDWRYWNRYREWLELSLSDTAIDKLDKTTDKVLGLLEDPTREGRWDRRGLVVGYVQSGKTAHYTGLICKAADAGYKIIIVLAGLHNNLRSQTQMRLDEGFLGYETSPRADDLRLAGVGEIDGDPNIRPNYVTNRADSGDFNTAIANRLGITPESRPWLFVIKKNKTVLERLHRWISDHVANTVDPETNKRIVSNLPLMLIDDEADNASVDTGEQVFDADGKPDEEHQPTAINRLIRRILHSFTRSAYVGYTATPFANIFIHERGETKEEGPDLFPAAFIITLGAPSDYIGPDRVFGTRRGENVVPGLPLVRQIADHQGVEGGGWMPPKHRNGHRPLHEGTEMVPPSLQEAIDAFILACSARRVRGQANEHASMLIHVTRFTSVQELVYRQVDDTISRMRQRLIRRIDCEPLLTRLQGLWESDFVPTTHHICKQTPELAVAQDVGWEDIERVLPDAISDLEVRMVNGTAKDALDYEDHRGTGLKVIAIGGDKLSRGLTLEGLCVSYFLRASRMYDTLMQMGRWFGYRPGYADLCRLYTTDELSEWFQHVSDAAEELREEFELMAASGATPREYGLKVQSHPVLMVTSRLKMRTAHNLLISFSGQLLETVSLHRDSAALEANWAAFKRLVNRLGNPERDPVRERGETSHRWGGSYLWSGVPWTDVVEFLQTYRVHPAAYKVHSPIIAEFIENMARVGELTHWTIALIGAEDRKGHRVQDIADNLSVAMLQRKPEDRQDDRYSIGRLMSPRDESIDLDEDAWKAALQFTRAAWRPDPAASKREVPSIPNGPAIRKVRGFGAPGVRPHPERGVFFLYLLDPQHAGFRQGTPPIVAFGASFPGSNSGIKVEYKVNHVLWEQEYGAAE